MNVVILANEIEGDHYPWIEACECFNGKIQYRVVDLTTHDWLERIAIEPFDFLLTKPGGRSSDFQQLYSERCSILSDVLNYALFPSADAIKIYENKRLLSYWLNANKLPCPDTKVFYYKSEAEAYLDKCRYPIVAKTSIGASGSGVTFLRSKKAVKEYLDRSFSDVGIKRRSGPNLAKKNLLLRGLTYVLHPKAIKKKSSIYAYVRSDIQRGYVIFQEFIDHKFEWRVVRIGDSFFAHKKIKVGHMASGTLKKEYENPPLSLLNFVKEFTDKSCLFSQAVDIFETERGYLINEVQCIFGQSDSYQMLVDGIAGRYLLKDGHWVFEEGDWAKNQCYNLRLEYLLDLKEAIIR